MTKTVRTLRILPRLVGLVSLVSLPHVALAGDGGGLVHPLEKPSFWRTASDDKPFTCPPMVKPLVDLSHMSIFYKPERTMSVVDPARMKTYVKRLEPKLKMVLTLGNLAAHSVRSPAVRASVSGCIAKQLQSWAENGALLGGLEENDLLGHRQAVMEMIWSSIAFSNAYAISRATAPIADDARSDIERWFRKMQAEQIAEFTPRPRAPKDLWLDMHANHWLWAGASVSSLAALTGDRKGFDWGMRILDQALDEAPADGGLPHELSRGQRAVHYQSFATTAIAVLLANADANGHDLTPARQAKLGAIARFSLSSYFDPSQIQAMTGKRQERKADMLGWAPSFAAYFKDRDPALSQKLTQASLSKGIGKTSRCDTICMPVYKTALDAQAAGDTP